VRAGRSGIGATRPLRRIPAIVSFLNPQPALSLVGGNRSSCPCPAITRPWPKRTVGREPGTRVWCSWRLKSAAVGIGRMRGSALLPERFRENVVCACFRSGVVCPTPEEVAMTTPPRTRRGHSLVYLIAGALAGRGQRARCAASRGGGPMLHNPAGCGAPAGRIDPSHLAAGAALDRAGTGHGRAHPPRLRGAGYEHANNAGRHHRRRAARSAGRLQSDRAELRDGRLGPRRHRRGPTVRHAAE